MSLECWVKVGGAVGRDEAVAWSWEGFGLYLESYGHTIVFVNELSNMGNSKNNKPEDKRTGFKNGSFTNLIYVPSPLYSRFPIFKMEFFYTSVSQTLVGNESPELLVNKQLNLGPTSVI